MSTVTIEKAPSPFAHGLTGRAWGKKDGRTIYACPATGALYFDRAELPTADYQDYYPYLEGFDEHRARWELEVRRSKYRRQLKAMARYSDGRALADIGAGPGYLVRVAQDEGWDAVGVEIAEDAVRFGEANYGVRYVGLEDIPANSLDAITCHHVLEHIDEPLSFLESLWEKLKPEGLLVLHVPHQQPLTFAVRDRLGRFTGSDEAFCCLYGDIHVSGFTLDSLRTVVEHSGFTTHFVRSAGMWTRYYDPFFVRNFARDRAWVRAGRKVLRHAVESLGTPLGMGDWVIGYFAKSQDG